MMKEIPWTTYQSQISNYLYLKELNVFLDKVISQENPDEIILFGSLACQDYGWESDIDLFVLFDRQLNFMEMQTKLLSYGTLDQNMLDVFPYHRDEFNLLSGNQELFIFHALKNSVLIYKK